MMPSGLPAYDAWAEYYDVSDADRAPFIAFYTGLLSSDMRSLLELGCGTGTLTIALQEALGEVTRFDRPTVIGVDESAGMLLAARGKPSKVQWVRADMRKLPFRRRFDLVVSCFNTLQHLLTDDDLLQTFQAVRDVLSRNGLFAFDIYQPNVDYLRVSAVNRLARAVTTAGRAFEIREDARFDDATQILHLEWRFVRADNAGHNPVARANFALRQYFPEDVDRLLALAGLRVRERFGDFDRSPHTSKSRKQVVVCELLEPCGRPCA